jgi:hypothetical protein
MAIKPFKRKAPNYFSGFTKLKAATLDSQFNEIATYINKEIVPTLNTLTSAKIPGSINPLMLINSYKTLVIIQLDGQQLIMIHFLITPCL